jgi:C1A family cysteine protease
MGLNQFSAMTQEEFAETYLNAQGSEVAQVVAESTDEPILTTNVNWVTANAVAPIKNQGTCPLGYAFSAIAAIESAFNISTGSLTILSEQQQVDCSGDYGNAGCLGG